MLFFSCNHLNRLLDEGIQEWLALTGWKQKEESVGGRNSARLHVLADKRNNIVHGSARIENSRHPGFFHYIKILLRNNAAHQQEHVSHFVLPEQLSDPRNNSIMSAGKNREPNHIHVFLQ